MNKPFRQQQTKNYLAKISDFDLRLLRVFRAVVDSGGFSNAEVSLNVSRSAISISMSDLEERMGVRLCQRGRAGFSLTEEGKSVYEATLQLMNSLETFRTQVNSLHNQLRGELSIGITDNMVTMDHMNITKAIKKLKSLNADVQVQIRMLPPAEIEKSIIGGSLHVGVVPKIRDLKGITSIKLYSETSYLYCGHQHALFNSDQRNLSEQDIFRLDAVASASAKPVESLINYQQLNTTATSNDREGVAFLILTGEYIGFLPDHVARQWLEKGMMKAIKPKQFQYQTQYQVISKASATSNLLRDYFIDLLQSPE